MQVDQVTVFTSEIKAVEIHPLSDELTLVVPEEFDVEIVTGGGEPGTIKMVRR